MNGAIKFWQLILLLFLNRVIINAEKHPLKIMIHKFVIYNLIACPLTNHFYGATQKNKPVFKTE
jgi:hypothetical protein